MSNQESGEPTVKADHVEIGYHPSGFRIDRTASPMNRYTRWTIAADGEWEKPEPVCFHSLPDDGWVKAECFDWSRGGVEGAS